MKNKIQKFRFLAALLLTSFIGTVWALPAQVIITRNGERPPEPKTHHDLAIKGWERAGALPPYFAQFNEQNPIVAIYATRPSAAHPSRRPEETCGPTAKLLGLPLNLHYKHGDEVALAQAIKNNPAYQNKTVVICWQHGVIPAIASALGVTNPPQPWPDNVFDVTWIIRFVNAGTPRLAIQPQQLLYGDSKNVPKSIR
jgi:hypothetical protein